MAAGDKHSCHNGHTWRDLLNFPLLILMSHWQLQGNLPFGMSDGSIVEYKRH